MIIELCDYIRFKMRYTGLCTLAEKKKITYFSVCLLFFYAIFNSFTYSVGFKVTIRTSFVAIASVWKFLPRLGANAMS